MRVVMIMALLICVTSALPTSASPPAVSGDRAAKAVSRGGQNEGRWRYVWHNDHWWYWNAGEQWSYFDGRRWVRYHVGRPLSGAMAAAYRKAPAFEKPPAVPPQPPRTWTAEQLERDTGLPKSFYLEGGPTSSGTPLLEPLPVLSGPSAPQSGAGETRGTLGTPRGAGEGTRGGARMGGGFGGPKGGSLGAGSAAGGASTPR